MKPTELKHRRNGMKKLLLGLVLGFALHMLYMDTILLRQSYIIDNCDFNEPRDENGELPCLKYGNDTARRFYGKYFGIYALIPWKNLVTGPWKLE